MPCTKLDELPAPPSGKTGWPWTEESRRLPSHMPDGSPWPRISIVTPSFNQGQFIEETIRSVLLQGYPELEYLIVDGGSTDGTVEIVKQYSPWLSYWVSERDAGQSDAINRGLNKASGVFATWINSDDLLCKNAIVHHASKRRFALDTVYIGDCIYIDATGKVLSSHRSKIHSLEDLVRIRTVWRGGGHIVQPEVLFPRALAVAIGGLNTANHFTMDFELWGNLFLAGAKVDYSGVEFALFRRHGNQKSSDGLQMTRSLIDSARKLVCLAMISSEEKNAVLADLDAYQQSYSNEAWKTSGRLARVGLPRQIVLSLRGLNAAFRKKPGSC